MVDQTKDEFSVKMKEIEQGNIFMQNEVHHLVQFQQELQEMGLLTEKGILNKTFMINLSEMNQIVESINQLNVMMTTF